MWTILSVRCILPHLILITTLWGNFLISTLKIKDLIPCPRSQSELSAKLTSQAPANARAQLLSQRVLWQCPERELGPFDEGGREGVKRREKKEKKLVVKGPVLSKSKGNNSPGTAWFYTVVP